MDKTPLIDESWTDYDENYPIQSNQNEVIYARVIDSTGQSAQIVDETTGQASAVYTSTQIKNIDKLEPEIKNVESIKTTTNSIKVKVTANDQSETSINSCSGIKGYYYSNDDGQKYSEITTEPTYTFEDLTQGTNYKIKVKVEDNAGNINVFSTNLETNTVAGLTKANTQFAYNPSDWTNGNVTVTLPTKSPYTTVYSTTGLPDANSTKYTGPFSVGSNCTIYYAYSDGSNVGKYGSLTVDNIDKNAPNAQFTPASANKFVTQSVNIAVSIDDGLSGVDTGNCKWVFNTTSSEIGTNQNSYSGGTFSSNNQTITVSASSAGTYYLHVLTKDGVGNLKETISSVITFKNVTLSLSSTSGTVAVNGTKSATINGSNYGSLSASSSNSSVATASISGTTLTITARSSGTATITVRESNLGRTASYSITGHAHSTACYRHVHSSYCYSTHYHSGSSSSGGGCYGNAVYKTVTETTYDNCSVRWVACSGSFNPQGKISVSSALCYQHYTPIYVNVTSNTMKCAYCGASYTISSYSCGHGYSATGSHNLVPGGYYCPGHTTTSQVIDYYTTSCGMSNGQSYLSCGRSTDYTYICGY